MEFGNYFMKYILIILSLLISFNVGASEYMCPNYKTLLSSIEFNTNQPSYQEVTRDEFIQITLKKRQVNVKIINKKDFSSEEYRLEIEDYDPTIFLDAGIGPSFLATLNDDYIGVNLSLTTAGTGRGNGYVNLLFDKSKKHFHLVLGKIHWTSELYFGTCKEM
jgi:hypothetical protein